MLIQLQHQIESRAAQITAAHPAWPCHKGCADCCRNLASLPQISEPEWHLLVAALLALPASVLEAIRLRFAQPQQHPFVCPLLDPLTNACLIYQARPIACRSYGFYVEREKVLGCHRIEAIAQTEPCNVVWGNHLTLEQQQLTHLGPTQPLDRLVSLVFLSTQNDPEIS